MSLLGAESLSALDETSSAAGDGKPSTDLSITSPDIGLPTINALSKSSFPVEEVKDDATGGSILSPSVAPLSIPSRRSLTPLAPREVFEGLAQVSRRRMDCAGSRDNRSSIFERISAGDLHRVKLALGFPNDVIGDAFDNVTRSLGARFNRQVGAYMGMVLGDYLGAPIEFLPARNNCAAISITDEGEVTYPGQVRNVFELEPGQWTDDASMGSCIADSLIVHDDWGAAEAMHPEEEGAGPDDVWYPTFVARDMRSRFWNWCCVGYNNAFRECAEGSRNNKFRSIGLGGNIRKSLASINTLKYEEIPDFFESYSEDSGNGGIMRLAPVPIFYSSVPLSICIKYCGLSSETTHPGALATRAAEFLGFLIYRAINRVDSDTRTAAAFIDTAVAEYLAKFCTQPVHDQTQAVANAAADGSSTLPSIRENRLKGIDTLARLLRSSEPRGSTEYSWNWKMEDLDIEACMRSRGDEYNGYTNSDSYYGSYCLDGLAVAMNAFRTTDSFVSCIQKCINYRGDADSTAAIAGQIAGAFYGVSTIPRRLLDASMRWDKSENMLRAIMLTSWFRAESLASAQAASMRMPLTYEHDIGDSQVPLYTTCFPSVVPPPPAESPSITEGIQLELNGERSKPASLYKRFKRMFSSKP
jgi:ADP-ribosylglycohydrolase